MRARFRQFALASFAAGSLLLPMGMARLLPAVVAEQASNPVLGRQAAPRPRMEFLGDWGTRGNGPANLNLAVAITSDSVGLVYIADAGSGFVHKFTVDGHPLLAFDDPRLTNPVAIAVDSDGGIYTADGRSGRVLAFSPTGDPDHEQRAGVLGRFRTPSALAVDADQNLYVADTGLEAVSEYDSRGRFVRLATRGSTGGVRVRTPVALAVAPDGSLFVADAASARILRFSPRGEFLSSWGQPGFSPLLTKNPVSLAASDRFLFCFDAAPPRLLVWALDGTPYFEQDLSAQIALSSGSGDTRASIAFVAPDVLLLLDPSSGKVLRFRLYF